VVDLWLDGPESLFRYLEVAVPGAARNVLVPLNSTRIRADRVTVDSIMGEHFAMIPVTRHPEQITLLEEERLFGFFGGGTLYADPRRLEPLL
jgi:photosynthetic reaction center H subunit